MLAPYLIEIGGSIIIVIRPSIDGIGGAFNMFGFFSVELYFIEFNIFNLRGLL